jgi:hypothetical protein
MAPLDLHKGINGLFFRISRMRGCFPSLVCPRGMITDSGSDGGQSGNSNENKSAGPHAGWLGNC